MEDSSVRANSSWFTPTDTKYLKAAAGAGMVAAAPTAYGIVVALLTATTFVCPPLAIKICLVAALVIFVIATIAYLRNSDSSFPHKVAIILLGALTIPFGIFVLTYHLFKCWCSGSNGGIVAMRENMLARQHAAETSA